MSVRLSVSDVQAISEIAAPGVTLRHPDRLEGAVEAPFVEAFGLRPYPTVVARAAKLAEGISRVQSFSDGNKRTGWLTMVTYLNLNNHELEASRAEDNEAWMLSLMCDPQVHSDCAFLGHSLNPEQRSQCQKERLRLGTLWLNDRTILATGAVVAPKRFQFPAQF